MEKDNAIIIILLILIVLSVGVYAIITGVGFSFNHDDQIGHANYTVNNTTANVNNTNNTTVDTTRDTGIYAPSTESSYSDSGSYYSSSQSSGQYYQSYSDSSSENQAGQAPVETTTPDSGQSSDSQPTDDGGSETPTTDLE